MRTLLIHLLGFGSADLGTFQLWIDGVDSNKSYAKLTGIEMNKPPNPNPAKKRSQNSQIQALNITKIHNDFLR